MGAKEPTEDDDEVVSYAEPSRGIYKKLIIRGDGIAGGIMMGDSAVVRPLTAGCSPILVLPASGVNVRNGFFPRSRSSVRSAGPHSRNMGSLRVSCPPSRRWDRSLPPSPNTST